MIAGIVRRDLPFYDASTSEASVAAVNEFAQDMGGLGDDVAYDRILTTRFSQLWLAGSR